MHGDEGCCSCYAAVRDAQQLLRCLENTWISRHEAGALAATTAARAGAEGCDCQAVCTRLRGQGQLQQGTWDLRMSCGLGWSVLQSTSLAELWSGPSPAGALLHKRLVSGCSSALRPTHMQGARSLKPQSAPCFMLLSFGDTGTPSPVRACSSVQRLCALMAHRHLVSGSPSICSLPSVSNGPAMSQQQTGQCGMAALTFQRTQSRVSHTTEASCRRTLLRRSHGKLCGLSSLSGVFTLQPCMLWAAAMPTAHSHRLQQCLQHTAVTWRISSHACPPPRYCCSACSRSTRSA